MEIIENVDLESILLQVGFTENSMGFVYDFGNCQLKATKVYKWFSEVYQFSSIIISNRSACEIQFDLPLMVESFEQGVAFLAFNFKKNQLANTPEWFKQGVEWEDTLPGRKDLKAYRENPVATVEHEWFRLIVKKLREYIKEESENDLTLFSFDGSVLRIECGSKVIVAPADGKPWNAMAIIKSRSLDFLPKRISNDPVNLFIWKERLNVGRRVFEIYELRGL